MMLLLFIAVLVLLSVYLCMPKSRIQRMAANIPGPRPFPIIGTMYHAFTNNKFLNTLQMLFDQYGPVLSLWFGPFYIVALSDPQDIEVIYKNNFELDKAFTYKKLMPWLGDGLVTNRNIEKWRKHRKALTPTFHFKILEDFMPVFNRHSITLTSILQTKSSQNIDALKHMTRLTLDILCETAIGVRLNCQLTENSRFLETTAKLTDFNMERAFNVFYMADWIFFKTAKGKEVKNLIDYMNGFVDSVIKERQAIIDTKVTEQNIEDNEDIMGKRKLRTFLDLMLHFRKTGEAEFSDIDIRDEVQTFMFAGHDTSAVALSFLCHAISQHPTIQEKLYQEQKSIFGDAKSEEVTFSHLSKMKYLENVIKETLRRYPPSVFQMRTLKNDLQLNSGYTVPAGGCIMILTYFAHMNPKAFPDPLTFNPDRFDSPEANVPFSYVPFGAGPRNCIGQRYAMMEMKVVMSHIIRNFKLIYSNIPLKLMVKTLLKSETGIHIKLEPRT